MLEIKKLSKAFSSNKVLGNINFKLDSGDFAKLSGKNGSGKSTLFKIIKNIIVPDSGLVLASCSLDEISYVGQNTRSFFYNLTCQQNLDFFSVMNGNNSDQMSEDFLEAIKVFNFDKKINLKVSQLSSGELKKLMLLRGFLNNPKIILLDEVENSLDKKSRESLTEHLEELNKIRGTLVFWATHQETISKKINKELFLVNGEVLVT